MDSKKFLIKHPSAWIPIAMSLTVVGLWFIGIAIFGVPSREPDEGTAAHIFQIWIPTNLKKRIKQVLRFLHLTLFHLLQRQKLHLLLLEVHQK